jgi:hypothetical protein
LIRDEHGHRYLPGEELRAQRSGTPAAPPGAAWLRRSIPTADDPPDPTLVQTTQSVIIDITSTDFTLDGAVVASVPIGGSDEVWYDPGTKHYFLGAPTWWRAKVTQDPSVAADKNSHNVFVPIGFVPPGSPTGSNSTNPCPTNGCVAHSGFQNPESSTTIQPPGGGALRGFRAPDQMGA